LHFLNNQINKYFQVIFSKEEDELIQESYILEPSLRQQRRDSMTSFSSEISGTTEVSEENNIDVQDPIPE